MLLIIQSLKNKNNSEKKNGHLCECSNSETLKKKKK